MTNLTQAQINRAISGHHPLPAGLWWLCPEHESYLRRQLDSFGDPLIDWMTLTART